MQLECDLQALNATPLTVLKTETFCAKFKTNLTYAYSRVTRHSSLHIDLLNYFDFHAPNRKICVAIKSCIMYCSPYK